MITFFHVDKHKSEWINKFYNPLQTILKEKKLFIISGIACLALFVFSIITGHQNRKMADFISLQNKQSGIIVYQLDDINSILHEVATNPLNSKKQQIALQSLEQNIIDTQKSIISVAKISDIQKISSQITSVKDDIDLQIDSLKKSISEGVGNKQFLDTSVLPFHVISVDVIAGEPYVSVEYENHILPLAISDSLAGWQVISADYESGSSEFMNEKNQYVKVSLQGA